jgi:NhaP-type Na+/H+ or K+/H+ antiporter
MLFVCLFMQDSLALGVIFAATDSVAVLQVNTGSSLAASAVLTSQIVTHVCTHHMFRHQGLRDSWPAQQGAAPCGRHEIKQWIRGAGLPVQVLRPDRAPLLYSLVFGEGVINDATAVALLRAVQVG